MCLSFSFKFRPSFLSFLQNFPWMALAVIKRTNAWDLKPRPMCQLNMWRSKNEAFEWFWFCSRIRRGIWYIDHNALTQRWPSRRQVRLSVVKRVHTEWDYTSTMRNSEHHAISTQSTLSLTLHWLGRREASLCVTHCVLDNISQHGAASAS